MIYECAGRDNGKPCAYGLFFDEHVWVDDHYEHPRIDDERDSA